jgi:hypothetical protein
MPAMYSDEKKVSIPRKVLEREELRNAEMFWLMT